MFSIYFGKFVENYSYFIWIVLMILKFYVCYVRFSCMMFKYFHHCLLRFSPFLAIYIENDVDVNVFCVYLYNFL